MAWQHRKQSTANDNRTYVTLHCDEIMKLFPINILLHYFQVGETFFYIRVVFAFSKFCIKQSSMVLLVTNEFSLFRLFKKSKNISAKGFLKISNVAPNTCIWSSIRARFEAQILFIACVQKKDFFILRNYFMVIKECLCKRIFENLVYRERYIHLKQRRSLSKFAPDLKYRFYSLRGLKKVYFLF